MRKSSKSETKQGNY